MNNQPAHPAPESSPTGPKTRSDFWGGLLFVHALMLVAAAVAVWWRGVAPLDAFEAPHSIALQAGIGIVAGAVLVVLCAGGEWLVFRRSPSTDHLLGEPVFKLLTVRDSLLIALLTGPITEFLWRGTVQPGLGLVATTIAHGAIHVFFAPTPMGRALFVVYGTLVAGVCGLLSIHSGLVAAMALRATYELIGSEIVRRRCAQSPLAPPTESSHP